MAVDDSLTIDHLELDDARWFSREQVVAALAGDPEAPFQPPSPWAIARTLLDRWADGLK
jgi:NAD+ diphosphatase